MNVAIADPVVKGIVLTCAGQTFIAGADIAEFGNHRSRQRGKRLWR